jgi:hypothetical protein
MNHNKTSTNLDLPKTQNLNKPYKYTPTNDKSTIQEKKKTKPNKQTKMEKKIMFLKCKGGNCSCFHNVLVTSNLYIESKGGNTITTKEGK